MTSPGPNQWFDAIFLPYSLWMFDQLRQPHVHRHCARSNVCCERYMFRSDPRGHGREPCRLEPYTEHSIRKSYLYAAPNQESNEERTEVGERDKKNDEILYLQQNWICHDSDKHCRVRRWHICRDYSSRRRRISTAMSDRSIHCPTIHWDQPMRSYIVCHRASGSVSIHWTANRHYDASYLNCLQIDWCNGAIMAFTYLIYSQK